jgi:AcrR family transcriptional regulator
VPGGRPRTFVAEEALDGAVEVFWRQGYEGTSMADLTAAMGMNRPSLYVVFGSKEELFRKAVARYAERDMAYARAALDQPTAFEVAQAFLRDNLAALTRPDRPAGCLTIQGGLSCGSANHAIAEFLAASRLAGEKALADRFARAITDGGLPDDADPAALARYLMVVAEGHAVHAAAGISRSQLEQSAAIALRAFTAQYTAL